MTALQPLTDERITAFKVESFAESFLNSPLARAMFERGEPLKFFLPVHQDHNLEWQGVNITIAAVPRETLAIGPTAHALGPRGNGHSGNPPGPLRPGDFGVHSHPDTETLVEHGRQDPGRKSDDPASP